MMNRSTQKELIKLLLQLNETWPQLDLSNMEQQNMVLDILNTVSTKCQKDFSKVNADRYVDTMESLGQIIKMTDWQHTGREELAQCISLCQEIILQVINNLRNEKELKKDIVFLPYKASMWDSLESVWRAAYEDKEHCNTYVIPIPYCDRNPDGSVAQWHCEIGEYPDYVPVLDFRKYSGEYLEEMHPDVIFFHNPYDEYNRVTSVDEQYYSRNLKKYTHKLVYIPYFVSGSIVSEHMCQSPGIVNADNVIVESEEIKRQYELYYPNGKPSKGKFLALGSPKYDRVRMSKREYFELPEEWRRTVEGKKVILYCTTLQDLLENDKKYINKLCNILEVFKKLKDVVLWWRPHPLMKATLKSIRPDFFYEYKKLEQEFISESKGIFDNTPDVARAIAYTDAYYGDRSSILWLYRATGKPVMVLSCDELQGIAFDDAIKKEKNLYFFSRNVNGFFLYDIHRKKLVRIAALNDHSYMDRYNAVSLYFKAELVNGHCILFPNKANSCLKIDMETYSTEEITTDLFKSNYTKILMNGNIIEFEDNFWFLPSRGDKIICVDKQIKNSKIFHKWYEVLGEIDKENVVFSRPIIAERNILFLIKNTNIIIKFSIDSHIAKLYQVGGGNYVDLAYNRDKIWIISSNGSLYYWKMDSEDYGVVASIDELSIYDNYTLIYREERLYVFSSKTSNYAVINLESYHIQYVKDYLTERFIISTSIREIGEYIYILPIYGNAFVRIGGNCLKPEVYPLDLSEEDKNFYREHIEVGDIIEESNIYNLQDLLEDISNLAGGKKMNSLKIKEDAGKNIYRQMIW